MEITVISILNTILIGIVGIIILVYLYVKRRQSYWERRGVPHVKAKSLIYGNLRDVMVNKRSMFDEYTKIYRQFENEPYCGLYEFHYPILMVRDPQLIQAVLVEQFSSFQDGKLTFDERADEILACNPFFHSGTKWKEIRSMLAAGLTPTKLRSLEEIIKNLSQEIFQHIDKHEGDLDLYDDLTIRYTSEMVANFGWGIRSNGFSSKSTIKEMFDLVQFASSNSFELMLLHPLLSRILRLRFFPEKLCTFLKNITEQAAANAENNKRPTFLQNILNAKEKLKATGKDMSLTEMAGYMAAFYVDGYETTARILAYVMYNMVLFPDWQKKVRDEINKVTEEITLEGVSKLTNLDMFISEVLRYYPIIVYLGRFCSEDCKLGSLEVKKGQAVIIPVCSIHNDPNHYPNSHIFNPENFSEENKNKRHKFTHFPFGQGSRMCLGMRYVMANIKLLLFYLLKDYEILPPKEHPLHKMEHHPEVRLMYINKDPMYVTLKKLA